MTKTHAEFLEETGDYALIQVGKCAFYGKEREKNLWLKLLRCIEQIKQFQAEQKQVGDE